MSNFFTPVYLFHANNISFSYTTDRNLRILHISLFSRLFYFFSNWYLAYLFTVRMLPSASAYAGILLIRSCLLFHACLLFSRIGKMSTFLHGLNISFSYTIGRIYGSSCLFSCLYTFFMGWYLFNLFQSEYFLL